MILKIKKYFILLTQWHLNHIFYSKRIKRFTDYLDCDKPIKSRLESPIIIIGMHRSGTSLLTRLLEDLDVFMGDKQGRKTSEDLFFRRRNELLFSFSHANWDNPNALLKVLKNPRWKSALSKMIADDVNTPNHKAFSLSTNQLWGFKDPRNTVTLPIWLDIFPNAKVIHIVRNGHAVSSSLQQRAKRALAKKGVPSLVSLSPSLSMDLWADYVLTAHQHLASLSVNQRIEIQYEELLTDPSKAVNEIAVFLERDTENMERINKAIARVKNQNNPFSEVKEISKKAQKVLDLYNY